MIIFTLFFFFNRKVIIIISGDSMANNNGHQFSTRDRDNDGASYNCAEVRGLAGWWYSGGRDGSNVNLNGVYYHSPRTTDMEWNNCDQFSTRERQ